MTPRACDRLSALALLVAVLGLPHADAVLSGHAAKEFFAFPPRLEIPTDYPRFSRWAAGGALALIAVVATAWLKGARRKSAGGTETPTPRLRSARGCFPWWGWSALGWTAAWWILAWTRWAWFEPLQRYTFFPLWLGFIVTVNALVERETGTGLMRRSPRR